MAEALTIIRAMLAAAGECTPDKLFTKTNLHIVGDESLDTITQVGQNRTVVIDERSRSVKKFDVNNNLET